MVSTKYIPFKYRKPHDFYKLRLVKKYSTNCFTGIYIYNEVVFVYFLLPFGIKNYLYS